MLPDDTSHLDNTRWRWVFAIAIVVLAMAGSTAVYSLTELTSAISRVDHTTAVLQRSQDLLARLADAETGERGFLLTGEEQFLAPYQAAVPVVREALDALGILTADDLPQQVQVSRLRSLTIAKIDEMEETLSLYRGGRPAEALAMVSRGEGRRLMEDIRAVTAGIRQAEEARLTERSAQVRDVRRTSLVFVAMTTLAAIVIGLVAASVNRQFAGRNAALVREIHDRHVAQESERRSVERLRLAIRSAPVTVYTTDREARYTWIEKPFADLPPDAMLGRRDEQLFPAPDVRPLTALKDRVLATGTGERQTIALPLGGASQTLDVTAEPLRDADGRVTGLTVAAFDLTPIVQAQRELAARERFTQSILDNSGDCIQVLDRHGRVVSTNPAGLRLLELGDAAHAAGTSWTDIWLEGRDHARAALAAALDGRQGRFRGLTLTTAGGVRWWDAIVTPVPEAGGAIETLVSMARDITDQRRGELEREELLASERTARSEAERAARAKDEFVATLSHELRTPLNAILGWTHIVRNDRTPETVARGFDVIERNIKLQAQLIEDLLDMNRILSGKIRLEVQRIDLADVVDAALSSVEPAARAKHIRVTTVLGSVGPINGDPGRLQQIVWNLLTNAIKFTPKDGRVQVTVSKAGSHAAIVVSDSGEGIAPAFLPYVFERFRQADGSTSRVHGGLGLGLAIVKQLVELHGGTVSADSEGQGRGATFTVRIPLALSGADQVAGALAARAGEEDPLPAIAELTVLVCDDEADARDLVERLLHDRGATVHAASSVAEALGWLRDGLVPDVIVSDIGMPRQDGYELIRAVRSMEGAVSRVPAAALTALARVEDRRRVLLAGYQTHVAKPVEPSELIAVVASLAGRTGRRARW